MSDLPLPEGVLSAELVERLRRHESAPLSDYELDLLCFSHEALRAQVVALTEGRDTWRSEAVHWNERAGRAEARVAALEAGLRATVWQFNEAVSMLREARGYLLPTTGLAEEIDEGIDAMQTALVSAAALLEGTEPAEEPERCPTCGSERPWHRTMYDAQTFIPGPCPDAWHRGLEPTSEGMDWDAHADAWPEGGDDPATADGLWHRGSEENTMTEPAPLPEALIEHCVQELRGFADEEEWDWVIVRLPREVEKIIQAAFAHRDDSGHRAVWSAEEVESAANALGWIAERCEEAIAADEDALIHWQAALAFSAACARAALARVRNPEPAVCPTCDGSHYVGSPGHRSLCPTCTVKSGGPEKRMSE